ncbi:MAG: transcriptional regulator NrdR [Deltaproteobacteria bacterium GWC2_42_51]|nr:MAG: transcriptional regulator NrdR [Deltaproteobacteria bacterium GWA2_42_85]OGP31751.1 MAG: transcriptional regulator NrdR [Deltaproteobacteria bacterium GWB2_42_7]OGP32417.1 MAG: transcriptional regulator NrdR [Deltaproteobacteria bacterium GWC2_42_51]OGP38841.1 MAG: transcriptional regulator NrdR [Deltaproteobacteria bacterium GWD2_42_10]OGP47034.1 MAG: transcriptional regulator NrdR [Deltaproteobacteria bacterium GWF2_42_12]OGQ24740.1 MAG: transcriptional regulator NrdR [Deltaproteobac
MRCPFCNHIEDKVIDSRLSQDGDVTRRRRECLKCSKRFTTYERVEEAMPLIIKKDGRRELFDRKKILNGILRACEKRPVSIEIMEQTVDKIERGLLEAGEREMSSSIVGERVMEELKNLDEVAYVRFASVYREFRDITEFMTELKGLLDTSKKKK